MGTRPDESLEVFVPADEADALEQELGVEDAEPGAATPEEYTPDPPIPFEASSADIVEQHLEVPHDPAEEYR